MKKLTYLTIIITVLLIFNSCQDDDPIVTPANNSSTPSVSYATDNKADWDITLDGTMFFDNSTGSLYSVDGIYSYSHRYIDAITPDPNNPFYPLGTPDEEWHNESHLEIEYSGNGDKNVILFFENDHGNKPYPNELTYTINYDTWFGFALRDIVNYPIGIPQVHGEYAPGIPELGIISPIHIPDGLALYGVICTIALTQKDIINDIYTGTISMYASNTVYRDTWDDIVTFDGAPGEATEFTAEINFHFELY